MNSFVYQASFFILIYIQSSYTFSSGAPNYICDTMMPGHQVDPRQCSGNYLIHSDKSQYSPNEAVRIIVNSSTTSDTFRGILLIAKTETTNQIIGTWSTNNPTIKALDCNGVANTGVTHNSRSDKTSIEAVWTPPSTISTENTIIKATIVKIKSEIYVDCFSIQLTNRQINQSSNATTTASTSSTTILTTTAPSTSNAGVTITWTYTNSITTVKMKINNLQTSQWVALGLSLDRDMGEDHVFICQRLSDDTVRVERRINEGGYSRPVSVTTMSNPGGTFTATSQRVDNGAAYCEFTLSNFVNGKRRRRAISSLSQSTAYYPLIAIGNLDSSNEIIKHTIRSALSQSVQLNREETILYNGDESDSERPALMKAHGILMIFTWILFVSTGILVARYFKKSWPERKICGKPIWFAIHRALMTSVAVLTIIAFILILVYEKGRWIPADDRREFAHSIVGIIIISFAVIQPIMALFRCKPDAQYRFIFNYVHAFVGSTAFLLSIVAIFLAMFFSQFNFEENKQWGIIVAWTCWVPIIYVLFWLVEVYFHRYKGTGENAESYDLGDQTAKENPAQGRIQVQQDRVKLILLIIHIVVALGLAIALASVVGKA